MNTQKILASLLLAAALAGASAPAAAAESLGDRAAVAVGHWIASQGNQALRDIREEFRQRLLETLKPALPAPAPAAPAPAAGTPSEAPKR